MRTLLFGFLAGITLSALRLPAGLDLTQVPAADAMTAVIFRAAALAAIAVVMNPRRTLFREGVNVGPLLVGATLGFAAHGLVLQPLWEPYCRIGFGLLLVGLTAALAITAGRRGASTPEATTETPSSMLRTGTFLAAVGATLALEHLARYVRLLGLGTREEETVVGAVVLTGLAVGAVAFGAPLAHARRERFALAGGLSLAAASTFIGLRFIGGLQLDPLYTYLDRFDFDLTMIGIGRVTAVLSGASFVLTAFLVGMALSGAGRAGVFATLLLGAAVGVLLDPLIVRSLAEPLVAPDIFASTWAWTPFTIAVLVAGVGSLAIAFSTPGKQRFFAAVAALAAMTVPFAVTKPAVWSFSPWYLTAIQPILVIPTAQGQLTVEPEREGLVVTLDRRRLTPTSEEEGIDAKRMRGSWSLLDAETRTSGAARVLLVGQLTPARESVLSGLGAASVDRTATWHRWMDTLEDVLFEGAEAPPTGKILSPAEARRRIDQGSYDLIIVPPVRGAIEYPKTRVRLGWAGISAPLVPQPDLPDGTMAVTWVDLDTPMGHRPWSDQVILALDRFLFASLGFISGEVRGEPGPEQPALLNAGSPRRRAPTWWQLETRSHIRGDRLRADLLKRLEEGQEGGPHADLLRGLALHYAAQTHSSPFETLAQRIEFDEDEARAFLAALSKGSGEPLDALTRSIWESLAWILAEKLFIEEILVYVEPVADAYGPWPALDRAVVVAYGQFDLPVEAMPALRRLVESDSGNINLLAEAARVSAAAGFHEEAIDYARRAKAIQPGRRDLRRLLGEMLMGAGDPSGRQLLEELFELDPDDLDLLRLLTDGPVDPDPFAPIPRDHDH